MLTQLARLAQWCREDLPSGHLTRDLFVEGFRDSPPSLNPAQNPPEHQLQETFPGTFSVAGPCTVTMASHQHPTGQGPGESAWPAGTAGLRAGDVTCPRSHA